MTTPREELTTLTQALRAHLEDLVGQGTLEVPRGGHNEIVSPVRNEPNPREGQDDIVSPVRNEPSPRGEHDEIVSPARNEPSPLNPSLADVRTALGDCTRCRLSETRQNIVFGVGPAPSPLMFIGEAPGAEEDKRGEPFVGRAGQLLDKMIAAMGWGRDSVYIANVLKCRPPGNRDPKPDEVEQCEPFLARQIDVVRPRILVTLGKPAAHLVLKTNAPISALRGRFQDYRGIKVMPTFHPAYLLRSPDRKREAWSDLQQVMAELSRLGVSPS